MFLTYKTWRHVTVGLFGHHLYRQPLSKACSVQIDMSGGSRAADVHAALPRLITIIAAHWLLTMQRTESQAEFLHESHGMLQTESLFFPLLSNLDPSGFYTFALCLAPFCSSLVLPSLFAPLCDLHGQLPVCVRRASGQSAVEAVILLVAIYYRVVRLKKD